MKLLQRIERLAEAREKATEGEWQCFGNALIPPKPENIGLRNSYNDAEMLAQAANEIIPLRDEVRALVAEIDGHITGNLLINNPADELSDRKVAAIKGCLIHIRNLITEAKE